MLLTCSKDGYLRIHDFDKHAYEPRKNITTTAISWNVRNQLVILNEPINRAENVLSIDTIPPPPEATGIMKYVGLGASSTISAPASTGSERRLPAHRSATLLAPPVLQKGDGISKALLKAAETIKARFGPVVAPSFDPGFDPALLQYFAEYYRYQGASIGELCEYNSNVARAVGKTDVAQSWVMLRTAFSSPKELMLIDEIDRQQDGGGKVHVQRSWEGNYVDFDGDDGDLDKELYPGYIRDFYRYFDYLEGGHENDFMDDVPDPTGDGADAAPDLQYFQDLEDSKYHIMNDILPSSLKLRGLPQTAGASSGIFGSDADSSIMNSPTSFSMLNQSSELMGSPQGAEDVDFEDLGNIAEGDDDTEFEDSATLDLLANAPMAPVGTLLTSPRTAAEPASPVARGPSDDAESDAPGSAEKGSGQTGSYATPTIARTPGRRSVGASTPAGLNYPPSNASTNSSFPPSRGQDTPSGLMSPPTDEWELLGGQSHIRSSEDLLYYGGTGVSSHPSGLNSAGRGGTLSNGSLSSSQAPSGTQTPAELIAGMSSSTYGKDGGYGAAQTSGEFLDDIEPISVVAPVFNPFDGTGRSSHGSGNLAANVSASIASAAALLQSEREFAGWGDVSQSVLHYYQDQGDVQTCVYMTLVLHDMMQLPKKQVMSWFMAYVDILHRLQLYHYATEIIKHAHLDSIKGPFLPPPPEAPSLL